MFIERTDGKMILPELTAVQGAKNDLKNAQIYKKPRKNRKKPKNIIKQRFFSITTP